MTNKETWDANTSKTTEWNNVENKEEIKTTSITSAWQLDHKTNTISIAAKMVEESREDQKWDESTK